MVSSDLSSQLLRLLLKEVMGEGGWKWEVEMIPSVDAGEGEVWVVVVV